MTKLQCQLEVLTACKIKIKEYEKERDREMCTLRNESWSMQGIVYVGKKDKQKLTFMNQSLYGTWTGISFFK